MCYRPGQPIPFPPPPQPALTTNERIHLYAKFFRLQDVRLRQYVVNGYVVRTDIMAYLKKFALPDGL